MRNFVRGMLGLSLLASAVTGPVSASPDAIDRFYEALFSTRSFAQVAISPDGTRIAWVESLPPEPGRASDATAIWVAERLHPERRQRLQAVSGKDGEDGGLAWSPDSKRLAYLSNAGGAGVKLYLSSLGGGPARALTDGDGFLAAPRFSPDGKTIAVLHTAGQGRDVGPTKAQPKDVGVIGENLTPQRLALVDLEHGGLRDLSPANLHVYEYDWSPDGKRFAITAAAPPGNANWWVARLFALSVSDGSVMPLYTPPFQISGVRVSPDGRTVAVIQGLMSDADAVGGDIVLVPADGRRSAPLTLTAERTTSVSSLAWLPDGDLLWVERDRGGTSLARGNAQSISTLWRGDEMLEAGDIAPSFSVTADGKTVAVAKSSFSMPPEIWTVEIDGAKPVERWSQLTHENANGKASWGKTESVTWNNDGLECQGWLLYPADFDPAKSYPMVVWVHGGPSSDTTARWPAVWTLARSFPLSERGYFVFYPNDRGSYGRGEAFTQANVKDFGGGDLRDLLAGVDQVARTHPVDVKRLGIGGWSYGGYMVMWAVTQTDRFRAAMAGAGIANWQSYYGQNGISTWMIPFFGASVYDDPAVYAKSSPIEFIKHAKTPTLILAGESDAEVPAAQSFEFYRALKFLNVPAQLVVYPGEGHAISQPENRRDLMRRMADWFDRFLAPQP
ncbi:MAG: S9 family peptidase [Acidobacteriota bacterium]